VKQLSIAIHNPIKSTILQEEAEKQKKREEAAKA